MDLIFPLSLPPLSPSASGFLGNESPNREHDLRDTRVRDALRLASLGRAQCMVRRAESADIPEQLSHEAFLAQKLALARADVANVEALLARSPNTEIGAKTAAAWPSLESLSRPTPLAGHRRWLVKPVHLNLGLDHLVLASGDEPSLRLDSAMAWCQLISDALEPDWQLQACIGPDQETYFLLDVPGHLEWLPKSSNQAMGRSIDRYLPQGQHARAWRRFLNHAQMLFHDHPLNDERQRQGQTTINGLWLEGELSAAPATLYRTNMAELERLPMTSLETLISERDTGRPAIILLDDWIRPTHQGDIEAWQDAWRRLPVFARRFHDGNISKTQVLGWHFFGETGQFSLATKPSDRWRIWRKLRY
jgi:hypothetical protein